MEIIDSTQEFEIVGIVDAAYEKGSLILGHPVLGHDAELPELSRHARFAAIGVGQIKSYAARLGLHRRLKELGLALPVLRAATAIQSRYSTVEEGSTIGHHALVNAGASVGKCCILNSGCIVEHDARVGDYCHVSTGATINGSAIVESGSFIGSGAVVREGVTVGTGSLIGAGVVLMKSCDAGSVFRGVTSD